MRYWLVKTEPEVYSIDDLARDKQTLWTCVRNYQARNFMQEMAVGDTLLVYHSSSDPSAIVGIAKISKIAEADPTQFEKKGEYYDPKASQEKPRWFSPTVKFVSKLKEVLPLEVLRTKKELRDMVLLQKGSRLSVQPVTAQEFTAIAKLAGVK